MKTKSLFLTLLIAYTQLLLAIPAQPTVDSVTPNSGPTTGGTQVAIMGTNVGISVSIHFGSIAASFIPIDFMTAIATAPPSLPGTVDVTVTDPMGNTSAINPNDLYTYIASGPTTPLNGIGIQVLHRFPAQGDLVNQLSWTSSAGGSHFNVYRDSLNNFIAEVAEPHYSDHQRIPGNTVTYFITAVDSLGNQSPPLIITVSP